MTNNEILRADILDILFEKRNKDYGAYALRKTYDKRLLTALCGGLLVIAVIIAAGFLKAPAKTTIISAQKDSILIREYVVPQKKIEVPVIPKQYIKQKSVVKTSKVKMTSRFDIKKDDLVKETVTPVSATADKIPGDETVKGKPDDGTVKPAAEPGSGSIIESKEKNEPAADFRAIERNAEFPGGPEALNKYLANNLRTPEDLANGEKKEVKIRFRVDADGNVNGFEIVSSGGPVFDKEVLRVCKKMPRWSPAFQNGINVPVNYMIPVTFIGAEL